MGTGRVLVVADRLSRRGGADAYLHALVSHLCGRGEQITILCGGIDGSAGAERTVARVFPPLRRRGPDAADARDLRRLGALVDSIAPSSVLVQNVMSPAMLGALATIRGAIHVLQDHRAFCPARGKVFPDGRPCDVVAGPACDACFVDDGALQAVRRDAMLTLVGARRDAARRFAITVILSRYMHRQLDAEGWDARTLRVVPPAAPGVPPASPAAALPSVAVVGRIAWQKGAVHLLRSLGAEGVHIPVTFVGSGPAERDVRDAALKLGMASRVRITGWLDPVDVAAELSRARMVAVPSLWAEPFGMAGLEAAASGLPVVAHAVGGIPEWAGPGTALLSPPADGTSLARAIARLAADPAEAARLGAAARRHATDVFSQARFAGAWDAMLGRGDVVDAATQGRGSGPSGTPSM